MRAVLLALVIGAAVSLSGCSKFRTYNGPQVTQIVVHKSQRKMYLLHNGRTLKSYDIDLGFAPEGHKQFEGDGRTPEGRYIIDRRNPDSEFHLSLGISYPNVHDKMTANEAGKSPGGDIFIHGGPRKGIDEDKPDWTYGCIAVTDREIEQIYAMVKDRTVVDILP